MLYLAIDVVIALLGLALRNSPRAGKACYLAAIFALFGFIAFRFEVGCDWSGYFNQFNLEGLRLSTGVSIERRQVLWWFLLTLQHKLELPYPWINVAAALGLFAGIHALAVRQPDRLNFLALLFPVLLMNVGITQLRQGLAIGVICFAFIAFEKRRPVVFALLTALAAAFHTSALAFLPLIPFVPGRLSKRNILIAACLSLPGLYFLVAGDAGDLAIQRYVDTDVDAAGALFRTGLLLATAAFFFVFLRSKWQALCPADFKLVHLGAYLMLVPLPLALYSSVIGDRFAYYLIPLQAMILGRVRFLLPRGNAVLAATHALLALFLLVWIIYSYHFQLCYIPYKSWLFGFPASSRYLY